MIEAILIQIIYQSLRMKPFYLIIKYLQLMLNSIINHWSSKSHPEDVGQMRMIRSKSKIGSSTFTEFNKIINSFHDIFLYGQEMFILHKDRPKKMNVYLDHKRDKLIWISSQTKAFIIDLYFANVNYRETSDLIKMGAQLGDKKFSFSLKELDEQVFFLFSKEEDRKKYFILFKIYSDQLKKAHPNYSFYFSNINKLDALNATQKGSYNPSQKQLLEISLKIGLKQQRQNKQILKSCMSFHNIRNSHQLTIECIDDYFSIQFCNRHLQPIFQEFSQQKIGNTIKDPRAILKKVMQTNQFSRFLEEHQKQSKQKINKILKQYNQPLSFFDFCSYLYNSNYNSICGYDETPDTYPLKDYFCYSSHNTYLSGNQLNSDCKAERYAEDFENGVKCVELDIHNDGGNPIVTHAINGTGFCKPVNFEDVIKVVDEYSQKCITEGISHFPIILSLQNHASIQNKQMMLDIMTRHFGKTLFFLDPHEKFFPSLSFLKGKIIIKTNSLQRQVRQFRKQIVHKNSSINQQILELNKRWNQPRKLFSNQNLQSVYLQFTKFKKANQTKRDLFNSRISKIEQIFIPISSMAKFTTIFKSQHGVALGQSQFACTSLQTGSVLKKPKQQLIKYTSNSWLRTYPHATQFKSANYDPAQMLAVGAQIIALNTQTKDDNAWMLYRYFCGGPAVNMANRGYVLKPERLRNPQIIYQTKSTLYKLTIQLIETGGYNVTMRFRGLPEDNIFNKQIQGGVKGNICEFKYLYADQSFILFDIGFKYKDCVALRWISQGYRVLQARNIDNYSDSGKRVLVDIKIQRQIG